MITERHDLEIFADHHQVLLKDADHDGDPGSLWTTETVRDMVGVDDGIVGFATLRDMDVPVRIELHDAEPMIDASAWDQIVECSVTCPSARLRIMGCSDHEPDAFIIDLPSEAVRLRILWSGMATTGADGMDGEDEHVVQIWPGETTPPLHVKRWHRTGDDHDGTT
jgi:hypothetical protein